MAEFGFTDEQELFRQEMGRFARKELAPLAKEKRVAEELQKANEVIKLSALNYPERCGGWTLDRVTTVILQEELYVGGSSLGQLPFMTTFNGQDLEELPEEVQDEIGPSLINMTATLTHGYTEANSGNEQAAIQTKAVRQGDYYVINGEKQPASGCAGATYNVITAVTDPSAGTKGISQFLVPRNSPGVSASLVPFPSATGTGIRGSTAAARTDEDAMGSDGCVMSYDDVKVPVKYRLGEEGEGYDFLEYQHNWAATSALAAGAIFPAKLTLNEMIEYTGQRIHFGRPIIQFQGVGFQIAEHYTKIEAARKLLYSALWLMDQGRAGMKDVSMAKWFCMEVGERALLDLLRIGGYAQWSTEAPLADRVIYNIGVAIADGPAQMQKLRILSEIAPDAIPPDMVGRLVT